MSSFQSQLNWQGLRHDTNKKHEHENTQIMNDMNAKKQPFKKELRLAT
jgi:hypothetical protein